VIGLVLWGCSGSPQPASSGAATDLESNGRREVSNPTRTDPSATRSDGARGTDKEWTLAIYLASETLSDLGAIHDVNALERRYAELAPFMDIIILADGEFEVPESNWLGRTRLLHIRADDTQRVVSEIPVPEDTELARLLLQNNDELELHSPAVLKAFLDYVQKYHPSKFLSVNIYDHGDAWKGAVYDFFDHELGERIGPMRPAEFSTVFSSLSRPIDVLGFDACLMQELSVNSFWHASTPSVPYVVASEEIQTIYGWDWENISRRFVERRRADGVLSPKAFASEIVQAFDEEVDKDSTLSALDLSVWSDVLGSLDQLGAALLAEGAMSNTEVKTVVNELVTRHYGGGTSGPEPYGRPDLVDVADFCRLLEQSFADGSVGEAASALRTAVGRSVLLNRNRDDFSSGLSMYLPKTGIEPDLSLAEFEKLAGAVLSLTPNWHAFLRTIR